MRYAVAAAAVAIATAARLLLDPWLGDLFPFATLFFAVLAVAWYGGFGPALAASLLGAAISAWALLPPRDSLAVFGVENHVGLALYVLVSLGIALLGGAMHTARLRAEQLARLAVEQRRQLAEREERYRQIVEEAHEGIWQLDANGRTRFANRRMAQMLGCSMDELNRGSVADFLYEQGREEILGLRERRRQGIAEQVELRFRRKDGSEMWGLVSASPVYDANGEFDGVLGMISDVTERNRMDQALRDADQRKDEFLALLGHELRNPLAPLSNALQILKLRGADPAVTERARAIMERQVEHMVRLVDDLLDVSRLMRGKVELRMEPVEIAAVIGRAVETVQPVIDAAGHDLTVEIAPERLRVNGDVVRLAQVVANVLSNASKYTNKGGRIALTAVREGNEVVVRVRDNGIGIAPELLPRIFDMFFQAERRSADQHAGLGIGLSLVRALVEMHGGKVAAHSAGRGCGTEFEVRLPRLDGASDETEKPDLEMQIMPTRAHDSRVLVVDDNHDAAESLGMLLRLEGRDVSVRYDAASALAEAETNPPTLAFLDIGMPKMDGYELAKRFRAHPRLQNVVLVALTGWGQAGDRQRTREAGFDMHLVKPVEPAALRELLREHA